MCQQAAFLPAAFLAPQLPYVGQRRAPVIPTIATTAPPPASAAPLAPSLAGPLALPPPLVDGSLDSPRPPSDAGASASSADAAPARARGGRRAVGPACSEHTGAGGPVELASARAPHAGTLSRQAQARAQALT